MYKILNRPFNLRYVNIYQVQFKREGQSNSMALR